MSTLLEQASLVMIPSGYKEDVVYSQIPTDGSGDLSFTRASNGTRVNSAGLVEVVPWNLAQYSEEFNNAAWYKSNSVITANDTTAPNGTTTADKYAANGTLTSSFFFISQYVSDTIIGQSYTATLYAKAGTLTQMMMYLGAQNGIYWNLSNGQFISYYNGVQNITAYNSESVGNGWYKYTISINASNTSIPLESYSAKSGNITGNYTTADNYYLWGAQLNIGSTAKPYFPTTDRLNVPRLTYQNGGGGCPSLLLEPQRTNLLLYSEAFDNAYWGKSGSTITANTTTSPDGSTNADKIEEDAATGQHYILRNGVTVLATSTYSISIYAKKAERDVLVLRSFTSAFVLLGEGTFNLTNGTATGTGASIVNVGNGWYRCILTYTTSADTSNNYRFNLVSNGNYTGVVGYGLYLYGAQLEAGAYPTTYIPTTSSSATRVADYVSRSGLALTNSTFAVNFKPLDYVVELFDFQKTGGGRMFYIAVQSVGYITFNSVSGGTIGTIGSILPKNQTCKLAFTLNASTSNLTVFINGSKIGTYATNITTFGAFMGLQSFGYSPGTQIEQIAIFPSVLTDAECQSLTA